MPTKAPGRAPETRGRPTLYKGVRMRSRLEADFAAWLERCGNRWDYEPDCFADDQGQWLPDFRAWPESKPAAPGVLIELKSAALLKLREGEQNSWDIIERIDAILERTAIAWASEPEAPINLVFWTYGASEPHMVIRGLNDGPWNVWTPHYPFNSLWSGMGQWEQLVAEAPDDAEEAAP